MAMALVAFTAARARAGTGYALSFDGTSNQCVTATLPALASNYTVTAWVFPRAGGNLPGTRVGVLGATNAGGSVELLVRSMTANDTDPQYLELGRNGSFNGTASTSAVPTNQWVHLAVTVSTNKTVSYFINGAAAGSWNASSRNLTLGANICLANNVNGTRKFVGALDEVEIWSRALGAAEIQTNMNQTPNVADASLAAYWPFAEGNRIGAPAGITLDSSGNGNNGALINQPAWVLSCLPNQTAMNLMGDSALTNRCHTIFTDPGVTVWGAAASTAAGAMHCLALKADGSVVAWGTNNYSQLDVPAPAAEVIAVAAGGAHSLALKADGSVLAWGWNYYGQTNVPASATNIIAIAAGDLHNLALKADGSVVAWGFNYYGQTSVPASATNVTAIAASGAEGLIKYTDPNNVESIRPLGGYFSLALKADGSVVAWGLNDYGQTNVPASATNVIAIAAGADHSLALRADGSVVAWGTNSFGQTSVPASATNVIAIAAGNYHSLALKADGSVVAWGLNDYGQTNVPASATNVVAIAGGVYISLALKADGSIVAWGNNSFGQTSVPASVNYPNYPVAVSDNLDTNSPGIYTRTYTATNTSGSLVTANREVVVIDEPYLASLTARLTATNAANGARAATFQATVNPNGLDSTAYFQFGTGASNLLSGGTMTLPASFTGSNLVASLDSLAPGSTEHWRVVAINTLGQTNSSDQTLPVPSLLPGDANGDGVVSASEAAAVMNNYWSTTTNRLTGLTSAGQGQFTFGITNSAGLSFTILASTNLTDWTVLTNAAPEFLFNDASATNASQRYYRLRWP